ncbi:hypothetical protein Bhyg_13902 [Pseudolycoriella hygida]|uniref:Gustatory receptor n=1 Tax=Pseudolycoriella hygida TaxID=35572 RepID=A0A9Q0MS63_9DIPT|nr:hypothetical protein Bhyg_13902 [Pseudolycoriella hygida]
MVVIPIMGGVFCMTVFNIHNFYRVGITFNSVFEPYFLISSYELLTSLFNIFLFIHIFVATLSIYSVRHTPFSYCEFDNNLQCFKKTNNNIKAKKMGVLVHKVIAINRDKDFIQKLQMLSQQVLHKTPDFSFGLFSLTWTFAYTYATSVVTYIVILIQFENYVSDYASSNLKTTKS